MTNQTAPFSEENPLSEREQEVAELLATGASNTEIGRGLHISPHTVKVHVRNIFEKLAVNSRTEASMLLLRRGWISVPGMEIAEGVAPGVERPAPAALADRSAQIAGWQQLFLLCALLASVVALLAPPLLSRAVTSEDLLTDSGHTILGQPALNAQPRWDARTPLSGARSRHAMVYLGERIFVIGGESRGAILQDVQSYDLRVNEWQAIADLPYALANAAAAVYADHIFVVGGTTPRGSGAAAGAIDNEILDRVWRYDPLQDAWTEIGAAPNRLAGASLVAGADALYLLGGWDGELMRDEVWRLPLPDPLADSVGNWELVARLDLPKAFFGAVYVDERIYVVGGYDGAQELDQATYYAVSTGKWQPLPPLATPRGGLSLVYDGLALFALGGGWTRSINTHERLDPATDVWTNFPSPIEGEWRNLGAVSSDGILYLVGGWSGDYLGVHLQYQSTFRALLPVIITNN